MSRARFDRTDRDDRRADNANMLDFKAVEEWLGQKWEELDDKGDDAFEKQVDLLYTNHQLRISYFIGEDLCTDPGGRVLPYCPACRRLFFL